MLLAAGTGLAPMLSVMRRVLENEDDYTRLVLFYACKNYSDIICKDELDGYTSYWNFKVNYFLSQVRTFYIYSIYHIYSNKHPYSNKCPPPD